VGAASVGGDPRLLTLGRALADSVAPGAVKLAFFVVPFGETEAHPIAWGSIEGTLDEDRLTIERAGGTIERLDWDRFARYLATPLAQAAGRTFPPPEVVVDAASTREAEALVAIADAEPDVRCRRAGLRLTCVMTSERTLAMRDVLVRFAAEHMEREAASMVRPSRSPAAGDRVRAR
jgi:hypothetical protein